MDFWYNPPKDGSKFASLSPVDWEKFSSNSMIAFSEAVVDITDEAYILYAYAKEVVEPRKAKEPDFKFQPQLVSLVIHRGEYEKKQKKDDKWDTVKCKQSLTEAFLCEILDTQALPLVQEGKGFGGWIRFGVPDQTKHILLHGQKMDGTPVSSEVQNAWASETYLFITKELDKLKGVTLTTGEKKVWNGGNKNESEADRLKARLGFAMEHLAPYSEKCETLTQLGVGLGGVVNQAELDGLKQTMELLKLVMGD